MFEWLVSKNHTIKGRLLTSAWCMGLGLGLYHMVNAFTQPRITWFYTSLDAMIPWWPWTLPIYASLYAQCFIAACVVPSRRYVKALLALLLATIFSCMVFLILPAHYPRPNPASLNSPIWQEVFKVVYEGDGAGNTFPSIHVASTTLMGRALWYHRWRWLWVGWSAAIALSILTVKQHFIVDLIGGLIVAFATWQLISIRYSDE